VPGRHLRWFVIFLIGAASVTATAFGWRAAQIGSTAAFDDRTSISETITLEQGSVERAVAVSAAERAYSRYRADYAAAAALDRAGRPADAEALRRGATLSAASAEVFGRASLGADSLPPPRTPRPFDARARERAIAAESSAALDSPGALDPDAFAAQAEALRVRQDGLTRWAIVILLALPLYTIAETAKRVRTIWWFGAAGLSVYLVGLVGGLTQVFW
jgi:hypothetical protein